MSQGSFFGLLECAQTHNFCLHISTEMLPKGSSGAGSCRGGAELHFSPRPGGLRVISDHDSCAQ